jgi:hypothetical protein
MDNDILLLSLEDIFFLSMKKESDSDEGTEEIEKSNIIITDRYDMEVIDANNIISADYYDMENVDQINIQYNMINKNNMDLTDIKLRLMSIFNTRGSDEYGILLKRQNNIRNDICCTEKIIEQFKIPTFISQINNYLSEGKSVIIFVKYLQTLKILANKLNTDCIIYEGLHHPDIANTVNKFKKDISRVIICTYGASIGFTLEDRNGNFPRIAIMSGIVSDHILGRINWVESKTLTKQIIMFCKGTQEEGMCDKMNQILISKYY